MKTRTQKTKFEDAARELDADESEEAFDRTLRRIAQPKKASEKDTKPGQ